MQFLHFHLTLWFGSLPQNTLHCYKATHLITLIHWSIFGRFFLSASNMCDQNTGILSPSVSQRKGQSGKSLHLAPSGFWLFLKVKMALKSECFESVQDRATTVQLKTWKAFPEVLRKVKRPVRLCVWCEQGYAEGLRSGVSFIVNIFCRRFKISLDIWYCILWKHSL